MCVIPFFVESPGVRRFDHRAAQRAQGFQPFDTPVPRGFLLGGKLRKGNRILKPSLPILHYRSPGEPGIDNVELLQLLADVRRETTNENNVWPHDRVLSTVLCVIGIHVLIVDVVQESCPGLGRNANEVDELGRGDTDGVGVTGVPVRPDHLFAVDGWRFRFTLLRFVPGDLTNQPFDRVDRRRHVYPGLCENPTGFVEGLGLAAPGVPNEVKVEVSVEHIRGTR